MVLDLFLEPGQLQAVAVLYPVMPGLEVCHLIL
jgi:hypothetical protein